jgi:hypothetical protein
MGYEITGKYGVPEFDSRVGLAVCGNETETGTRARGSGLGGTSSIIGGATFTIVIKRSWPISDTATKLVSRD